MMKQAQLKSEETKRMKKSTQLLALFLLLIAACSNPPSAEIEESELPQDHTSFYGTTQGTTYSVIVNDPITISQAEIDEVLHQFDLALSTYVPQSTISVLNASPAGTYIFPDEFGYFEDCYKRSLGVYDSTGGLFDPTVFPLVEGWGFFKDMTEVPDSNKVVELRSLTGFQRGNHFEMIADIPEETDSINLFKMIKRTPNAKLDFNAIAQGQAVDVLCELIESRGGKNYFVEIGGEIKVHGKNAESEYWRIGIDKPIEDPNAQERVIYEIVQIENKAIATSGSYRKFYEKDGVKYSHTLNPKTGYPVQHSLLSATVIADNCALADAYATALMVMGAEEGIQFVKDHPKLNIEVYLIFNNNKNRLETYYTQGFMEMVVD